MNQRSTTPIISSVSPFHESKQSISKKSKVVAPETLSSRDSNLANKFFAKPNRSDELESIEKEKVEFSTFSIEQDIANLAHIKVTGSQGDHFVLEFDESDDHLAQFKSKTIESLDGKNEVKFGPKKQPTQAKAYIKPMPTIETKQSRSKEKSLSPAPTDKELENKRMIMEYIKTVKEKIAFMDKKLEEVSKDAEYYKIKSAEMETSRDKVIEKEKKLWQWNMALFLVKTKSSLISFRKRNRKMRNLKLNFKNIKEEKWIRNF